MSNVSKRTPKGNGSEQSTGLAELLSTVSKEELAAFMANRPATPEDRAELARWKRAGERPAQSIEERVEQIMARRSRLRALGVPEALRIGEIAHRARVEQDEARYQRRTMNPLRKKAWGLAAKLKTALTALLEAEAKRPQELDHQATMRALGAISPIRKEEPTPSDAPATEPVDEETRKRRQEQTILGLLNLCTPGRMTKLLRYLMANLDGPTSRAQGQRGRPRNLVFVRVQQALRENGVTSDGAIALVLRSEGIEEATETDDIKERVRQRRRRGGRK